MKKLSIIILFSFITLFTLSAQNKYDRSKQLNAGIGFSGWGVPVYFGMDFGLSHDVTLGFETSFRSYYENYDHNKYNSSIIGISGNANYHFNRILEIPRNWDFYAGLNIGIYLWSSANDYPGDGNSGVGLGAQIGGRYFFKNNLGLNLEFGGGNEFAQGKFGITYRF